MNHYYGSGCYECGGWPVAGAAAAGAAVGMAAGATAAYAASNAPAAASYTMGAIYTTLPAGCATPEVQGQTYYLCGNTWFSPSYGANGIFYRVVPVPCEAGLAHWQG